MLTSVLRPHVGYGAPYEVALYPTVCRLRLTGAGARREVGRALANCDVEKPHSFKPLLANNFTVSRSSPGDQGHAGRPARRLRHVRGAI